MYSEEREPFVPSQPQYVYKEQVQSDAYGGNIVVVPVRIVLFFKHFIIFSKHHPHCRLLQRRHCRRAVEAVTTLTSLIRHSMKMQTLHRRMSARQAHFSLSAIFIFAAGRLLKSMQFLLRRYAHSAAALRHCSACLYTGQLLWPVQIRTY